MSATPTNLQELAAQMHQWYLDATKQLKPESYNPNAQKSFDDLTPEQQAIDLYIAEQILERFQSKPAVPVQPSDVTKLVATYLPTVKDWATTLDDEDLSRLLMELAAKCYAVGFRDVEKLIDEQVSARVEAEKLAARIDEAKYWNSLCNDRDIERTTHDYYVELRDRRIDYLQSKQQGGEDETR